MKRQFTIVAVVCDREAGERHFTADEFLSTLTDTLHDLHLEVEHIRVDKKKPAAATRALGPSFANIERH